MNYLYTIYMYMNCSYVQYISFFFFSSRRRHTRCSRDWSSDVCASDLCATNREGRQCVARCWLHAEPPSRFVAVRESNPRGVEVKVGEPVPNDTEHRTKIGRASCRERV